MLCAVARRLAGHMSRKTHQLATRRVFQLGQPSFGPARVAFGTLCWMKAASSRTERLLSNEAPAWRDVRSIARLRASRAGVTQLAECLLPKQNVAGSNPVSRSISPSAFSVMARGLVESAAESSAISASIPPGFGQPERPKPGSSLDVMRLDQVPAQPRGPDAVHSPLSRSTDAPVCVRGHGRPISIHPSP